jgi:hypothetical protein
MDLEELSLAYESSFAAFRPRAPHAAPSLGHHAWRFVNYAGNAI